MLQTLFWQYFNALKTHYEISIDVCDEIDFLFVVKGSVAFWGFKLDFTFGYELIAPKK